MKPLVILPILFVSLFALTACQEDVQTQPGPDSSTLKRDLFNQEIEDSLSLEISYQKDLNSQKVVKKFSCQKDCPALLFLKEVDFSKPSQFCTKIYGGPEAVTLSGSIDGQEFNSQFKRTDGCQIKRFDSLIPLLDYAGF
jgi:hypothetical protein